jgi:hypothetical protein
MRCQPTGDATFGPCTGNLTDVNPAENTGTTGNAEHTGTAGSAGDDAPTTAVRRYLEFVLNPASARDDELISSLEAQVSNETDVVAKLLLLSNLERAKQVDGSALLDGFVRFGRRWAEQNQITVGALKAVGVSPVVLAEAGFDLGHGSIHDRAARKTRDGASTRAASPQRQQRQRGTNVSGSVVKQWALQQPGSFTMAEAMASAGASLMTVKKAVTELIADGRLRSNGHIARAGVRGRAPEHFSVMNP